MARYYVNKNAQANGDHEVHTGSGTFLPSIYNRQDLGEHTSCLTAVRQARVTYPQSNGCRFCSSLCHTS